VADGTGGHTFSASLKDHNSAVQTWRKLERDAKAKQAEQQAALPVPTSLQNGDGGAEAAKRASIDVPLPVRKPKR
jgi:UPF0755 protein